MNVAEIYTFKLSLIAYKSTDLLLVVFYLYPRLVEADIKIFDGCLMHFAKSLKDWCAFWFFNLDFAQDYVL